MCEWFSQCLPHSRDVNRIQTISPLKAGKVWSWLTAEAACSCHVRADLTQKSAGKGREKPIRKPFNSSADTFSGFLHFPLSDASINNMQMVFKCVALYSSGCHISTQLCIVLYKICISKSSLLWICNDCSLLLHVFLFLKCISCQMGCNPSRKTKKRFYWFTRITKNMPKCVLDVS